MIIHGDDVASSRTFFLKQQEQFPESVTWEGDKITLTDLAQIFAGGGLFVEEKYVFVEQFITKQKKKAEFKELIAALEKYGREHTIVLWENRELDRGALMAFPSATVRPFKLPQALFTFLDSLRPGNGAQLVKLFHQAIETAEVEMVFFMLVRQIRLLLALSSLRANAKQSQQDRHVANAPRDDVQIDEIKRMQPWQKGKLEKQAVMFDSEQLQQLYKQLFALEKGQKTGTLNAPLVQMIDFLLLAI
jgi:hypothetical protein